MPQEPLAPELQSFLLEHVESFEQLELLLLLCRERDRERTAAELAQQLRIQVELASEVLHVLCQRGLLAARDSLSEGPFCYQPREAALDAAVLQLLHAYESNRLEVMRVMSANAMARVRGSALRAFTGSFLLRKEKDKKEKKDG